MTLTKVYDRSPWLGCDPEFFFRLDGKIIGAEKVLPKDGLVNTTASVNDLCVMREATSKFIIDGVQSELNPRPNTCRANLANEIAACMKTLTATMAKEGKGLTADFSRTVIIDKTELMSLDEKSRKFGCAPSNSIYKDAGVKITDVDPTEYLTRAAGGHIHIGKGNDAEVGRALTTDHAKTVELLDIICGNTCVLVDRDEGNKERRKLYGRAGEFRLPEHGLEYRTLSNFWLTAYPLMSLSFGLARLAVQLMADAKHKDYYDAFTSKAKSQKIHDAINNNDFDLAMENFKNIEKLITEVTSTTCRYPIHGNNMKHFDHFVNKIRSDGLEYWFKDDPMTHWINLKEAHAGGFHDFSFGPVANDMKGLEEKVKIPEPAVIKAVAKPRKRATA